MKNTGTVRQIVVALLFAVAVLYAASYYVEDRQRDIVSGITLEIIEQEKTLSNIAEITDRNGADAVLESIILDCNATNRSRFDSLLNTLGTLNPPELKEIESLLNDCGRFFSERKAVMVLRMSREFEVYRSFVGLLSIVDSSISVANYKVSEWERLVQFENKRSAVFESQVTVQYDIIKALQNGDRVGSAPITEMLAEATNINQEAEVLNQQIDTLRSQLLDI